MKPAQPVGLLIAIAFACWLSWSAVILMARPAPPSGIGLAAFTVSMPVAWLASLAVILGIGHQIGTRLATP